MTTHLETLPPTIGKYRVLRRLGAGAMGEVFLCVQPELERHVAIKCMRSGSGGWERFQREARSAARLVHPHVVRVYDVGLDGEIPFIVMEYVDGEPLSHWIGKKELTPAVSLRILYDVAEALHAAHEQGVVHRDVKPSNILIDRHGRPKLADFGLAKSLVNDPTLSGSGDLIGTPRYMSPEQVLAENDTLDGRTDVFSLGVVMYEMLAGKPPFDGPHVMAILRQITDCEPASLTTLCPLVPGDVATICGRSLAKRLDERFANAHEMAVALANALVAMGQQANGGGLLLAQPAGNAVSSRLSNATTRVTLRGGFRWAMGLGLLLLMTVGLWWATTPPVGDTPSPFSADFWPRRERVLAQTAEVVRGIVKLQGAQLPRDVLREAVDELTALIKQGPDDRDLRLARARLWRHSCEYLAANAELTGLLAQGADDLELRIERLLARFQIFGQVLGLWQDAAVRYPMAGPLREDLDWLQQHPSPEAQWLATALTNVLKPKLELTDAPTEVWPTFAADSPLAPADLALLQADWLLRGVQLAADESWRDGQDRLVAPVWASRLQKRLRQGLEIDPHHAGLLFLRSAAWLLTAGRDTDEGEDENVARRRTLPRLEADLKRFRNVSLREGSDYGAARAWLHYEQGAHDFAIGQLDDAAATRPTLPHLHSLLVWLKATSPPDGVHSAESLKRLLDQLDSEGDNEGEYLASFIRGQLHAALGEWEQSRRQIRDVSAIVSEAGWPGISDGHQRWLAGCQQSLTAFLFATRDVLADLPVEPEARRQLCQAILSRLDNESLRQQEGMTDDLHRDFRAWSEFTLMDVAVGQDQRDAVLYHLRRALEAKAKDVHGEMCRQHWLLEGWRDDVAFQALFDEFPPTPEPEPVAEPQPEPPKDGEAAL